MFPPSVKPAVSLASFIVLECSNIIFHVDVVLQANAPLGQWRWSKGRHRVRLAANKWKVGSMKG